MFCLYYSPPFRVGLLDFLLCTTFLFFFLLRSISPLPSIPDRFSPIILMIPPVVPYTPLPQKQFKIKDFVA